MLLQAAPAAASASSSSFGSLIMIGLFIAVFYFFLIRPSQKQQKKRQEVLTALKVGDEIVTIGGLYGKIVEMTDDTVVLQAADNVTMKFARSAVSGPANRE